MKACKRFPLDCVNKCGTKDIPREEVSTEKGQTRHRRQNSIPAASARYLVVALCAYQMIGDLVSKEIQCVLRLWESKTLR